MEPRSPQPLGAAFEPGSGKLWQELRLAGRERGQPYNDVPIPHHAQKAKFMPPLKFWNPSVSPSGLFFYTGDTFKALKGNALRGGLSSEALIQGRQAAR